jgi:uncharacterized metal-binding protein
MWSVGLSDGARSCELNDIARQGQKIICINGCYERLGRGPVDCILWRFVLLGQ